MKDRHRSSLSLLAGLASVLLVMGMGSILARALWPGYTLAASNRTFTLAMLNARLTVGAIAVLFGGLIAARTSHGALLPSVGIGGLVLAVSVPWHVHIWNAYPAWYHAVYLGYVLPAALMGYWLHVAIARLTKQSDTKVR